MSNTNDAPKQVFEIIASNAPNTYILGTTARNSMVATEPVNANDRRKLFLYRPWSAAPLTEIIKRAWTSTLMEKVYIAKLAVLISIPRNLMMHCPVSARGARLRMAS